MPRQWNDECLRKQYERIKEDAKRGDGFTDDELSNPYLDKLSHQTKSHRIMRMIRLAYTLGWMRGIDYVDQGKTPVGIGLVGIAPPAQGAPGDASQCCEHGRCAECGKPLTAEESQYYGAHCERCEAEGMRKLEADEMGAPGDEARGGTNAP